MIQMIPVGLDQVILKGMIFHGHVGVYLSEKEKGQDFVIDVTIYCSALEACKSDKLENTIDYGQAHALIRNIVEEADYDLIERLADEIAGQLLDKFLLAKMAEVTVSKPEAPVQGRFASMGVHILRKRSEYDDG